MRQTTHCGSQRLPRQPLSTQGSRRRISRRPTALPWTLTFAKSTEKSETGTAVVRDRRALTGTSFEMNDCSRTLRTGADDPLQPAVVLSASGRCTSELDVRSRRRENKPRRQRSFERGEHRPSGEDPANDCIRRPCTANSMSRPTHEVEEAVRGPAKVVRRRIGDHRVEPPLC